MLLYPILSLSPGSGPVFAYLIVQPLTEVRIKRPLDIVVHIFPVAKRAYPPPPPP